MYVFVIIANLAVLSQAINNGVGRTPAMGFNNWNSGLSRHFHPLNTMAWFDFYIGCDTSNDSH